MDKSQLWRKIGVQAGILLLFIALSYLYMFPLLEGKVLIQPDIQSHTGMSKELIDFRKSTGQEAIWTNSMFGGMPGYMISVLYKNNLVSTIHDTFRSLFHPAAMLILYLICFYILLTSLKIDKWLSLAGAVAFGFSTNLIIIISVGHNTQAYALGYLMLVIAGVLIAYRYDRLKGAILVAIGMALEILAGHPQITYYGFLVLLIFGITELVYAVKDKKLLPFFKTTGILVTAVFLGVAVNFSYLYSSYKYSKETIRGRSELTSNSANRTSGLDKDYVVQWSEGVGETLTLLIPDFMGGSHSTNPGIDSESYKALQKNGVENPRQVIHQVIMYHGEKPVTSGPYYAGAILVFLFVLGLFVVKGRDKWWLLTATIVSVVFSWGKHIMPLTSFLLDYLPMYNKFRAPEMTLFIACFTIPLLGIMGLQQILSGKTEKKEIIYALKWSFGITAGVSLLYAVLPGIAGTLAAPFDSAYPEWLLETIRDDRRHLLQADAFRSFIFIALAAGAILLWHLGKIKMNYLYVALTVLILADLWFVDKRFVNNDNFGTKRESANVNTPTPADQVILKDKDISYRVLPIQNPWQDSRASYFHKNVGGYHPAKLRRYQEMIDHHLDPEIQQMVDGLNKKHSPDSVFRSLTALNMLNTRYFIYDLNAQPLRNTAAWGNAWFAPNYKIVANADEEIKTLGQIRSKDTVLVDKRFATFVENKQFRNDPSATISMTAYKPDYLKYSFASGSEQLTVFSEIYYKEGWKAYVDGKETPHFRANYVLRALVLPAGNHTIEFKFHPSSYYNGNKVSLAGSILLLLAITGYLFLQYRKK
jgi:hypothetical protein